MAAISWTRPMGAARSLAQPYSSAESASVILRMSPEDGPEVPDGLHDVAGAGLALGADHGRALGDAAQRLAEVGGAADEGDLVAPLVDVVGLVGRGEHLALVDVVHPEGRQHLGLGEVADPGLGHDRDGHRGLDPLDQGRIAHPGHAAVATDVGRHPLEGHDRHGAGVLGHLGLLGVDHVHDDPAPEHLGQTPLDGERTGGTGAASRTGVVAGVGGIRGFGHGAILLPPSLATARPARTRRGGPRRGRQRQACSDRREGTTPAAWPRPRSRCPPSWPRPGRRPP